MRGYIYNIHKNIKEVLEQYGYPFKSKEHSKKLYEYKKFQNENREPGRWLKKYFNMSESNYRTCPKSLMYQIEKDFTLNISDMCCTKLKKETIKDYMKQNGKSITMTGMMRAEGGQRMNIPCIVTAKDNTIKKFHPMAPLNEDWEDNYTFSIARFNHRQDKLLLWRCPIPFVREYLEKQCGYKTRWYHKLFWKGNKEGFNY